MRRIMLGLLATAVLSATAALARDLGSASGANDDAPAACKEMMQGAGVTEEGKKAMREFMQSDRAPQAMATMMEMARRMGNGDVMLGMTRMMEMMGGKSGGMMDGPGMMSPGREPQK